MLELVTVRDGGEFDGWQRWPAGHYEDTAGPFFVRRTETGQAVCAFRVQKRHLNGSGHLHGGCILAFADAAAYHTAATELDGGRAVTMTLNSEFIGPSRDDDYMECKGEVIRTGWRTVFVRGLITASGRPALNWSATFARIRPKP